MEKETTLDSDVVVDGDCGMDFTDGGTFPLDHRQQDFVDGTPQIFEREVPTDRGRELETRDFDSGIGSMSSVSSAHSKKRLLEAVPTMTIRVREATSTIIQGVQNIDLRGEEEEEEIYCVLTDDGFHSIDDRLVSDILQKCERTLSAPSKVATQKSEVLMEKLYSRDSDNNTLLHLAVALGWVDVAVSVIKRTSPRSLLDLRNDLRQTPLLIATLTLQPLLVKILLAAGADVTLVDRHGNTPYHIACRDGDMEVLAVLCTRKETRTLLCVQNYEGLYPVHLAATSGFIHILSYLHKLGVDMNERDGLSGFTPIHHAIRNFKDDSIQLVQYLVKQAKVDLSVKDFSDRTPLMFAEGHRCLDIVAYLVVRGPGRDWLNCPPTEDSDSELTCEDADDR